MYSGDAQGVEATTRLMMAQNGVEGLEGQGMEKSAGVEAEVSESKSFSYGV